jgi:hypothetical protein
MAVVGLRRHRRESRREQRPDQPLRPDPHSGRPGFRCSGGDANMLDAVPPTLLTDPWVAGYSTTDR